MFIARDKNNKLNLWKIKPIRAIDRFNKCSKEFQDEEIRIYQEVGKDLEENLQYWDFPNEVTPCEYIDAERYFEYSSKYKLEIDESLFSNLSWEDDPVEVNICKKYTFDEIQYESSSYDNRWLDNPKKSSLANINDAFCSGFEEGIRCLYDDNFINVKNQKTL